MYTIPKNLLSKGITNAKLSKNESETYILYLAPFTQNSRGVNLCPQASKGCAKACLFTSGRGKFSNVKSARINKTEYFLHNKEGFINQLTDELLKINRKALKQGKTIYIRLNGTSDLDFYKMVKLNLFKREFLPSDALCNLHFYDYTKDVKKVERYKDDARYTLTYSFSEKDVSTKEAKKVLKLGGNVAVVFFKLPKTFLGYNVIDGDASDLKMINNKAKVLGLKAKGEARKDFSGFVQ